MCACSYAAQEPAALTFATYCALAFLASLGARRGPRLGAQGFGRRAWAEGAGFRESEVAEAEERGREAGRAAEVAKRQVLIQEAERRGRESTDAEAPGALGIKERKVFESPPEPRARMAVIRDSLSPVDATSAFASAAAARASRRSGGRREPNTPLSRGMSEPERGV